MNTAWSRTILSCERISIFIVDLSGLKSSFVFPYDQYSHTHLIHYKLIIYLSRYCSCYYNNYYYHKFWHGSVFSNYGYCGGLGILMFSWTIYIFIEGFYLYLCFIIVLLLLFVLLLLLLRPLLPFVGWKINQIWSIKKFNFLFALSVLFCLSVCVWVRVFNHPQMETAIAYAKRQAIISGEINFTPFRFSVCSFTTTKWINTANDEKIMNKSKILGNLNEIPDANEAEKRHRTNNFISEFIPLVDRRFLHIYIYIFFSLIKCTCVKLCQALEFFNVKKFHRPDIGCLRCVIYVPLMWLQDLTSQQRCLYTKIR